MLPSCRQHEIFYPVPKFDLTPQEIENFMDKLEGFHEQFHDCFLRSESRENFLLYMSGQFSELERKSIEPIALNIEGGKVRALQRFVSDAPWDDENIMLKYRSMVNSDLGNPDGALLFDETSFPKKGNDSVGVARQYCGSTGKVDNCQVGVFAAYVSDLGYSLVDKRLFIPEKWFTEEYHERREKCKMPGELTFRTKPQLAAEMLNNLAAEKTLPFKYVLGDSIYGNSPDFIEAVSSLRGVTYFVSVPEDTLCRPKIPTTVQKTYKYRGKLCSRTVLTDETQKPVKLSTMARNINSYFWYRRTVSEGNKGPVIYEFTRRQVKISSASLPQQMVWVIIRRTIGAKPEYSYFISNASTSARLPTFVWLSGLRWAIEQCFEEARSDLGMGHYEVRKFPGWHHHMITCMLGHFFLWHLKLSLGKKSTVYYALADFSE